MRIPASLTNFDLFLNKGTDSIVPLEGSVKCFYFNKYIYIWNYFISNVYCILYIDYTESMKLFEGEIKKFG